MKIQAICPMCGQLFDVDSDGKVEDHYYPKMPDTTDPLIKFQYCLGSGMEAL